MALSEIYCVCGLQEQFEVCFSRRVSAFGVAHIGEDPRLTFPDLNAPPTELTQTNLILPEPCDFLKGEKLPPCSVIRPSLTEHGGAVATIKAFTDGLLFAGQSNEFFHVVMQLAIEADAAQREL